MTNARSVTWPAARLEEAVAALAPRGRLPRRRSRRATARGWLQIARCGDRAHRCKQTTSSAPAIDANLADLSTLCHMAAPVILRVCSTETNGSYVCFGAVAAGSPSSVPMERRTASPCAN